MSDRAVNDSVMAMYGLLAGSARLLLPPMFDTPVVRTLRTAMIDRMARSHGVTLNAGARRILVDIEESATIRGNMTQGLRWVFHRFVPGSRFVDAAGNLYRTYGAGVLLHRYFTEHRPEHDPVMTEIEAERVRAALRAALRLLEVERAHEIFDEAAVPVRLAQAAPSSLGVVEHWGEAVAATFAELPAAWLDVAERVFVDTLKRYQ